MNGQNSTILKRLAEANTVGKPDEYTKAVYQYMKARFKAGDLQIVRAVKAIKQARKGLKKSTGKQIDTASMDAQTLKQ